MSSKETAETLTAAEAGGLTIAVTTKGELVFLGDEQSSKRHADKLRDLPNLEVAGAALCSFVFQLARQGALDGKQQEFLDMLAESTARGFKLAQKEGEQADRDGG